MAKIYKRIAGLLFAIKNCEDRGNTEWQAKHQERLSQIMSSAPNGAGIDSGTKLREDSTPECLKFDMDYHHMNDGWTNHTVTIKPSLLFDMSISINGRDRNQIKDYLWDVIHSWLNSETDI